MKEIEEVNNRISVEKMNKCIYTDLLIGLLISIIVIASTVGLLASHFMR